MEEQNSPRMHCKSGCMLERNVDGLWMPLTFLFCYLSVYFALFHANVKIVCVHTAVYRLFSLAKY